MKGITLLKMLLDIVMCVIYLMLMFSKGAGEFFHEAAGIGIGILFLIHLIINHSMTKGLVSSIKKGSAKPDRKLLGFLDIILCAAMPIVIVTGILIAKELFMIDSGLSWQTLFTLHNVMSYMCLVVIALHIILHGKYLAGVCKNISSIKGKELKSVICRFSAGAAAMITLYFATYIHLHKENDNNLQIPETTNNKTEQKQTDINVPSSESVTTIFGDDEQDKQTIIEPASEESPTLEEYLGNLHCTGCHKRCSLLNPRCGRGRSQAEQAQEKYSQIYSS